MFTNAKKLISCLQEWRQYKILLPHLHDHQLWKDVRLIAGILFTSAIIQNGLTHWNVLPGSRKSSHMSAIEVYYLKHFPNYFKVVPYNPIFAIALFICDKCILYAWTFGDVLIAICARAIYKQFQLHSELIKRDMIFMKTRKNAWERILREHEIISELLGQFNAFFKPLIFACVSSNIYFIAITLNRFLVASAPSPSVATDKPHLVLLRQVNSVWAFLQLLAKTFTMVICCARVNKYALGLEKILWKCPISSYTTDVRL